MLAVIEEAADGPDERPYWTWVVTVGGEVRASGWSKWCDRAWRKATDAMLALRFA